MGNVKKTSSKQFYKFNERFIKGYNENSNKGYFVEVDVEYPKNCFAFMVISHFYQREKIEKYEKLVCNKKDKEKYVVHIRVLKQALNHELILKKVHRVIQFNQKAWLKPYIDMNTELRIKGKNEFDKDFFKLMNNAVFSKTMENVRKHRDIKLEQQIKKKLVSEPNYYTTKYFLEDLLLAIEMKKAKVKMNKPIYLGMSILYISETYMYEVWYDYIKPKYGDRVKVCYTDTDSFIIYIITENFYKDIANDIEEWFDTSMMKGTKSKEQRSA